MKHQQTSLYLLLYLTLEILAPFTHGYELLNNASEAVFSGVSAHHSASERAGTEVHTGIMHASMDSSMESSMDSCSDCCGKNHCLFSSCPSLPPQLHMVLHLWVSLSAQPVLFEQPLDQISDNLYRPPIVS